MTSRRVPLLVHLLGAACASALAAFWILRLLTPEAPVVPAAPAAVAVREPDPRLAARFFGDVNGGVVTLARNVQLSGVYVSGKKSSAVIAVDGKPPRAILLGGEVAPGLRLAEVRVDGITLDSDGVRTDYAVPPVTLARPAPASALFRRDGETLTAPSLEPSPVNAVGSGGPVRPMPGAAARGNRFPGTLSPAPPSGMLVPPSQQRGLSDDPNGRPVQPATPVPANPSGG